MKMKVLAAVLLLGSSSYALAADPALPIEEIPTGFNWTGGYVGGQVGYAWGDSAYTNTLFDGLGAVDPDGFFGGIYAGYNYQFQNNVVLGIDADLNASGIDGTADYLEGGSQYNDHVNTSDVKYSAAIRARLGYSVDRWLPYVAGGVSFARYNITLGEPGDHVDFDMDKTMTGWNIGGGIEYAATDNIIVRAEYRYSDFGSWKFDDWANGGKVDLKTNDIRLGVAYKF